MRVTKPRYRWDYAASVWICRRSGVDVMLAMEAGLWPVIK